MNKIQQSASEQVARVFSNNTMAINFSSYELPQFTEKKSKNVIFWGEDNLYPNYLLQLANQSSLHSTLITSIAQDIAGDGLNYSLDGGNIADKKLTKFLQSFDKNINETETAQSVLQKTATDLKIFNGFAWNIIWSKTKKMWEIYHMDMSGIRACPVNSKGKFTEYQWCNDWNYAGKDGYEVTTIPVFDPENKKSASQILYCKNYWPGQLYYPRIEYSAGIQAIDTDFRIYNYWLNLVSNSMTPSMFINFNDGIPDSEEEKDLVYARIQKMYGGGENAGKFILNFSESKETSAEVTPIQAPNLAEQYKTISEEIRQAILFSHKITSPMLVGIKTEGQLGGSAEILQANELFFNKVIRPKQSLIEQALEKILYINTGKEVEVEIQNNEPVKYSIPESILKDNFDEAEIRALYGYEPRKSNIQVNPDINPDINPGNNNPNQDNPGTDSNPGTAPTV